MLRSHFYSILGPRPGFACICGAIIFGGLPVDDVQGHTPVDFMEVVEVAPANLIQHGVDLKGRFDQTKVTTMLVGPKYFAQGVGCLDRPIKKTRTYLTWYQIEQPPTEPRRTVSVLDLIRGESELQIGDAEYFLSPAQLMTSGTPDPIPGGLDHYKAYRVRDAKPLNLKVEITGSGSAENRTVAEPLFVCLPAAEWHHEEHFAISHPKGCFVVYRLNTKSRSDHKNTIDQFGLNQLQPSESRWLIVRGTLLVNQSD